MQWLRPDREPYLTPKVYSAEALHTFDKLTLNASLPVMSVIRRHSRLSGSYECHDILEFRTLTEFTTITTPPSNQGEIARHGVRTGIWKSSTSDQSLMPIEAIFILIPIILMRSIMTPWISPRPYQPGSLARCQYALRGHSRRYIAEAF